AIDRLREVPGRIGTGPDTESLVVGAPLTRVGQHVVGLVDASPARLHLLGLEQRVGGQGAGTVHVPAELVGPLALLAGGTAGAASAASATGSGAGRLAGSSALSCRGLGAARTGSPQSTRIRPTPPLAMASSLPSLRPTAGTGSRPAGGPGRAAVPPPPPGTS